MSPAHTPRHLLVWSLPTVAVLLSFLWYKRRRNVVHADSGGIDPSTSTRLSEPAPRQPEPPVVEKAEHVAPAVSKPVSFSRSLSGVESTPIDIKTARSAPLVISDTELDLEIEKIKSMKQGASVKKNYHVPQMAASPVKKRTPAKSAAAATSVSNASSSSTASVEADEELHQRGRSVERDSANHSPADAMMPASPTLSSISDNQSDSDSGKGGSDVATPPPAPQQKNIEEASSLPDTTSADVSLYEFIIPQLQVGRLIGRHGAFVHLIRAETNARILIKRHPDPASKMKVCAIEGTQKEIDGALEMIREKFPLKRYSELTLERVSFVPIVPDCMHLRLIEGVNNDTIVSCVVTPTHLFLQQPTHPTFPSLNVLTEYMNICYADDVSPTLPAPVLPGTICVAESSGAWYRASVMSSDEETTTACVQFLDYGGYATVPHTQLKQIRGDFLLLPFQASECVLANVEPLEGADEATWSQEAYDAVTELTSGAMVFTQVVDYLEDGVTPLVYIYVRSAAEQRGVVLLNRVLADRGFARWVEPASTR